MKLIPRDRVAVGVLGIAIGVTVGLGTHTFLYAKGYSYLLNDPKACANCHIMNDHFDAWTKSSHHAVASCNDCHTPHGLIPKYASKAYNGFFHAMAFTTGDFPDPIRAKPINKAIVQHACVDCHQDIAEGIQGSHPSARDEVSCARCHADVGHPTR